MSVHLLAQAIPVHTQKWPLVPTNGTQVNAKGGEEEDSHILEMGGAIESNMHIWPPRVGVTQGMYMDSI